MQEFHVVRCFDCETFQVHQVKKTNKWICKLCGKKQSLLKEFGRGSGADCRRHVQKLNAKRGSLIDEREHNTWSLWEQLNPGEEQEEGEEQRGNQVKQVSRWNQYLDAPEEVEPEEGDSRRKDLMNRHLLHSNSNNDRKRQRAEEHITPAQPEPVTVKRPATPSLTANRWDRFLGAGGQVLEEVPSGPGFSQPTDPTSGQTKLPPQIPVPSMFESGEEFSFDDDLQWV